MTELFNQKIGGDTVYESAKIPLDLPQNGYFADENVRVHFYYGSIHITDLTNAMQTGKTCLKTVFSAKEYSSNFTNMRFLLENQGINTVHGILSAENLDGFTKREYNQKGVRIFSPFVEVKPVKEPKKWTASHLAKAILSGQIFHGSNEGRYTDDYARDAECNFGRDQPVDLLDVARDFVEAGGSGFYIKHEVLEDGTTEISVAKHSFDYKKFSFDVDCTHENRMEQAEQAMGGMV